MKQAYVDDCPYYLDDFLTNMKVVKDRSDRTEEAYFFSVQEIGRQFISLGLAALHVTLYSSSSTPRKSRGSSLSHSPGSKD